MGVVSIAFALSVYRVGYNCKFLKRLDVLAGYMLDAVSSNIVRSRGSGRRIQEMRSNRSYLGSRMNVRAKLEHDVQALWDCAQIF